MNKLELDQITERIIGCAIEVHRHLGPGLLESVYESALAIEFALNSIPFERQKVVAVDYKGRPVGNFRLDFEILEKVIVEVKAVERHDPVFEAQVLSYLKLCKRPVGLLLNFNSRLLKEGIKRFINVPAKEI